MFSIILAVICCDKIFTHNTKRAIFELKKKKKKKDFFQWEAVKEIEEMKPEKIYALMGFKCVPPVYSLLPRNQ